MLTCCAYWGRIPPLSVCFPFLYLLLARLACRGVRALPNGGRWLPAAAVALLIAGQIPRVNALLSLGRGSYSRALADIAERERLFIFAADEGLSALTTRRSGVSAFR